MKTLPAILIFWCLAMVSSAQSDSLVISNVSISSEMKNAIVAPGSTPAALPDSIPFRLTFKISDIASLSKIYIKVGVTSGTDDILNKELTKITTGTEDFLQGAGGSFKIWHGSGYYLFKLPKNIKGIKWLTIYGRDQQGNLTAKKHYKF